jgi:hypothetical protein
MDLHTLQNTTAHAKFQSVMSSLLIAQLRFPKMEIPLLLCLWHWRLATVSQLPVSTMNSQLTSHKVKVMLQPTVKRPVCLGIKPHQDQIFVTARQLCVYSWGTLSVERAGLSFTIAAGP